MSSLRHLVLGVAALLLALCLGISESQSAVFTTQDLEVTPQPAGAIRLRFAADDESGGTISVRVYRMVSASTPVSSAVVVSSGQLILNASVVASGEVRELINVSNDVANQANGFIASTNTVNQTRYWYVVVASEPAESDTNSRLRGGTADMNQPQTFAANEFVASCTDGVSTVSLAFDNPSDEVIDFDSNPAMSPGTVRQVAVPYDSHRINYRLYEVTGSELFDVNNDPVSGNVVDMSPVTPYVVGNTTMITRNAPGGTALAYGMRVIDTVGNVGGGSPLSQNNTTNGQAVPGVVTPPNNVALSETMLGGTPATQVTFTINTASLVSDPGDSDPATIRIYGRIGSTPITSADLGSATILSTTTRNNANTAEVITFYHTSSTPGLPRTTGSTISYAATITTDNGKTSCVSNSPNLTTTDLFPPQLVQIKDPTDGQKVSGTYILAATVQDDAAGGGITDTTFTINPGNVLAGVDMTDFVGAASGCAMVSFDTTTLADGVYILSVTAADFANNTLETGSGDPGAGPNVSFLVDNTPPTVAFTSPAADLAVDGSFTVSGTASDANATILSVTLTYSTSGADASLVATGAGAWSGVIPVDPGFADDAILTVTAEALDDCGLIGLATRTYCVDRNCGSALFVQPAAPTVVGPNGLVLQFTADDDDTGLACDAGVDVVSVTDTSTGQAVVFTPASPPMLGTYALTTNVPLANLGISAANHGQTHTLDIGLRDGAFDAGHTCVTDNEDITIDYMAPNCDLSSPVTAGPFGLSVPIVGNATDVGMAGMGTVEVVVELSGAVQAATTFSGTGPSLAFMTAFAPTMDGVYDILVYATDTVGNGTVCEAISVLIDAGGPSVVILTPPDGALVNGSFLVTGTAQDIGSGVADVSVEYTTSGGTALMQASGFTPGATFTAWYFDVPVDPLLADDAVFDVTAIAADMSGQTDSATGSHFVDNVASSPVITMPTPGGSYFIGALGLDITQDASDDDTGALDSGFEQLYFSNNLNSVTFEVAAFDPPQIPSSGNGPFVHTLVPGATQAGLPAGQFVLGLADGDIAVVSSCFVDGATSVSNVGCATFEVVVDLTPPTCAILAPMDGTCFDNSNTILGASDVIIQAMDSASGLAEIGYRIEDQNGGIVGGGSQMISGMVGTATFSFPFTSLPDGTFTIIAAATDQVGNGTDCEMISVIRSSQAPVTTISNPFRAIVNGGFTASGVSVTPSYATGTVGIPSATRAGGGNALQNLSDDDFVENDFPGDFVFPFYGQLYDRMYVGSNGNITFGFGDDDETPTMVEFINGPPRIAAFWRDMNPDTASGGSGEVRVQFQRQAGDFANDRVHIRYINVPSVSAGGMVLPQVNSVTATLYVSGAIELDYGAVNGASGTIVGVAPGFGAPATLTDLEGTANTMAGNGYYEQFTTLSPSDLVDGSFVRFLPVTDLVGTQAATAVDVWYPGAGGSPLAPLSATMTAAATLTPVGFTGAIDEAIQVPFSLGFEFPLYGHCWNSVY
ncbi:MAG: hypothetical protein KC944_04195, partial [Candidatus Omnitrophica bacterium]|nr:hypothetical protein [Candidatus Omnitrophota bacterium]